MSPITTLPRTTLFPVLLSMLLITGCVSPRPISIFNAQDTERYSEMYWSEGKQVLVLEEGGVLVELSYQKEQQGYFLFNFYAENNSRNTFTMDPASFRYISLSPYSDTLEMVRAINPESRLFELDKEISRSEAREHNHAVASVLMGSAEFIAAVSNELSDKEEEEKEAVRIALDVSRYSRVMEEMEFDYEQMDLEQRRAYWEREPFRKTTLYPQQYIAGKVFFPKTEHTGKIIFRFPTGRNFFDFGYEHLLIPVD